MDNDKYLDRLADSAADSAKRQDDVFDRIQEIVKDNPDSAKQYLQHLTNTSKWELYSRIYGKFTYITLLILLVTVGLYALTQEVANEELPINTIIENLKVKSPTLTIIENSKKDKYTVLCNDSISIGNLDSFSPNKLSIKNEDGRWKIHNSNICLGELEVSIKSCNFHRTGVSYTMKTWQRFGEDNSLWFKIKTSEKETIVSQRDTSDVTVYSVVFGEGEEESKIIENNHIFDVYKSDNAIGKIASDRNNTFQIMNPEWEKVYCVELSIGKLGKNDKIYYMHGNVYTYNVELISD